MQGWKPWGQQEGMGENSKVNGQRNDRECGEEGKSNSGFRGHMEDRLPGKGRAKTARGGKRKDSKRENSVVTCWVAGKAGRMAANCWRRSVQEEAEGTPAGMSARAATSGSASSASGTDSAKLQSRRHRCAQEDQWRWAEAVAQLGLRPRRQGGEGHGIFH